MVEQRFFIMQDGVYRESSALDAGPLVHRSDEGGRKRVRNNSILMTINTQIALFFFVVITIGIVQESRWDLLLLLLLPGALSVWIFLDWRQYRRASPVTEIYEKGILLQKIGWSRQDGYFWAFEELGSVHLKGKTVHLRSKVEKGRATFPLYEVGPVGFAIIEKGFQESSSMEEPTPHLHVYGFSDQGQSERP